MGKFSREVVLDKTYQVVEVPAGTNITVTAEGGNCATALTASSKTAPVSSSTMDSGTVVEYSSTKTGKFLWLCGTGKAVIEG
jgi:hypothetical protein